MQELGFYARDTAVASILWATAGNGKVPDEVRALALSSLRGVSGKPSARQKELLEKWASQPNALGAAAKEFEIPYPERKETREDTAKDVQHFVYARDIYQKSRDAIAAKKGQLSADEQKALSEYDTGIKASASDRKNGP